MKVSDYLRQAARATSWTKNDRAKAFRTVNEHERAVMRHTAAADHGGPAAAAHKAAAKAHEEARELAHRMAQQPVSRTKEVRSIVQESIEATKRADRLTEKADAAERSG